MNDWVSLCRKLEILDTYSEASETINNRYAGKYLGVHITCNELGLDVTCRRLTHLAPPAGAEGCHVGFSGWFNFDVMVCRNSRFAVLCDVNPEQTRFLRVTLDMLRQHANRFHFRDAMCRECRPGGALADVFFCPFLVSGEDEVRQQRADLLWTGGGALVNYLLGSRLETNTLRPRRRDDSPEDEIRAELDRAGSWCSTWRGYEVIRNMALESRIATLTCDLTDTVRIRDMSALLHAHHLMTDTVYASNIQDYCPPGEVTLAYKASIASLLHGCSTLVVARNRPLQQHIHFGPLSCVM